MADLEHPVRFPRRQRIQADPIYKKPEISTELPRKWREIYAKENHLFEHMEELEDRARDRGNRIQIRNMGSGRTLDGIIARVPGETFHRDARAMRTIHERAAVVGHAANGLRGIELGWFKSLPDLRKLYRLDNVRHAADEFKAFPRHRPPTDEERPPGGDGKPPPTKK